VVVEVEAALLILVVLRQVEVVLDQMEMVLLEPLTRVVVEVEAVMEVLAALA
jgi:hypothetical protein